MTHKYSITKECMTYFEFFDAFMPYEGNLETEVILDTMPTRYIFLDQHTVDYFKTARGIAKKLEVLPLNDNLKHTNYPVDHISKLIKNRLGEIYKKVGIKFPDFFNRVCRTCKWPNYPNNECPIYKKHIRFLEALHQIMRENYLKVVYSIDPSIVEEYKINYYGAEIKVYDAIQILKLEKRKKEHPLKTLAPVLKYMYEDIYLSEPKLSKIKNCKYVKIGHILITEKPYEKDEEGINSEKSDIPKLKSTGKEIVYVYYQKKLSGVIFDQQLYALQDGRISHIPW
uniref:Uncharacterized protein n=1 Tax=Fervidobacterium pennivorans TaxID=93466 RepID=A0A7V4KEU0_FERPE